MLSPAKFDYSPAVGQPRRGARALIAAAWRQRRRRWRRHAVLAMVLTLAAGTAAASVLGLTASPGLRARGASHRPAAAARPMPSELVVWNGFKIEVLASRTGRILRTLATNVALYRGLPTVAVSVNRVVYFDDARNRQEWVLSVPLAGGHITAIAPGRDPAVSADGRFLAYVTYTDLTGAPEAIVVRNLVSGRQRSWAFRSVQSDVDALSWAPGGQFLSFTANSGEARAATAWIIDTRSAAALTAARPIPLRPGVQWAGFLTPAVGLALAASQAGRPQSLVEVAVRTGSVLRRLATLGYPLFTANVLTGTEGAVTADAGGRYLLIATSGPRGYGELYRLTVGLDRLVPVARGAIRASWVVFR